MVYTVGEMARRLGVAPSALRYYDKEGLLPFVERSDSGIRLFKESDYEWLQMIRCLKQTGMPLADIRHFIELSRQGDGTIAERLALIVKQKAAVTRQIEELNGALQVLEFKEWYYRTAREEGTTARLQALETQDLPEAFRPARRTLRGE